MCPIKTFFLFCQPITYSYKKILRGLTTKDGGLSQFVVSFIASTKLCIYAHSKQINKQ